MLDHEYMRLALDLAGNGQGFVSPNPLVGAVIVKDGRVIGRGYHEKYGGLHAERNALRACTNAEGATLYVTLEPCCHHGKTPPCTDAIIQAGIRIVVIGSSDPNPLVSGKGIGLLERQGIKVITGVLEDECLRLNEIFFHYITKKAPFLAMKYAMTLDGKIATCAGESRWITGEQAREHVHMLRRRYSAIMVGVGTVIADDPMLDCRIAGGRNPIRIICDTQLRTPLSSKIIKSALDIPTYIACCSQDAAKIRSFTDRGCRVLRLEKKGDGVDLGQLAAQLYEDNIDSVLLEGGAALNFSALTSQIVNKAYVYIAPKLLGGETAKTPISGAGIERLAEAYPAVNCEIRHLGADILLEYMLEYNMR